MTDHASDYDPRYLAGVLLFNRRDFFEAHEVWEEIWQDCAGPERRFYQGLIQAAVGLCHFGNGNLRGALKLYRTARAYMEGYDSPYLGLDVAGFWLQMEQCYGELLRAGDPPVRVVLDEGRAPAIELRPPPESWPDPADYLEAEEG